MLTLNCLASGSSGNCYFLYGDDGKVLILDCGIGVKEIKKALDFDLSKIAGVFVSHAHLDHALSRKDFDNMGVPVFAPYDNNKSRENYKTADFTIQAFVLPHGETTSYGALIRHIKTGETVLYCTDFEYSRFVFSGCKVNHFIVECNYQSQYVNLDAPNIQHKLGGHCSLKTCAEFIEANKTTYMQSVLLVHLGIGTTNPQECVEEIEKHVYAHTKVDYARANTVYELTSKCLPFTEVE